MNTLASVLAFAPWRMVAVVFYTHAQPSTANLGTGRSALEGVELRVPRKGGRRLSNE